MSTSDGPHFPASVSHVFFRYPSQEPCVLESVDREHHLTMQDTRDLVCLANEPLVYKRLFARRFRGQPYTLLDAELFFARGREGWRNNTWFVFVLRNPERRIVGTLDIQSPNLDDGEIGYKASVTYPGVMTNAVLALSALAKEAGYRRLAALVEPDNARSLGVMQRAHFQHSGELRRNERDFQYFSLSL